MISTMWKRFFLAAIIYTSTALVLLYMHDYPQFRAQLQKLRWHDPIAEKRQWLNTFYFINEAGSGIKFFLTGNEKHMAHFPSPSHLLASRQAKALAGDWEMQVAVARMYYFGEFIDKNHHEALRWLQIAYQNSPPSEQENLTAIIQEVTAEMTNKQPAAAVNSGHRRW